jgi:hypothetical protein
MKTFLQRLKIYAIGFGIGLIFVFFFFQNRGCSWLPDNRVKNSILDRVIVLSEEVQKQLVQKGIATSEVIAVLNDGNVDFSKSQKAGASKVYYIEKGKLQFYFTLPRESFISEVKFVNQPAQKIKNTEHGLGKLIHFPKDNELVFADTTAKVSCQQQAFGMIENRKILKSLKNNGEIDFDRTNFKSTPKSVHFLYFKDQKGNKIGASAVWYKNKITIDQFELPFKTDCK